MSYLPDVNKQAHERQWIDHDKDGVMSPFEDPSLPVEVRVEDLLSRMTLEERLAELRSSFNPDDMVGNLSAVLRRLPPKEGALKANEIQRRAVEKSRLGIPRLIHDECLHGSMAMFSTVFPAAIAMAATWDVDLAYRVAKQIGQEARARGIRQCLSPVVNLAWDQRAGRVEESYGEDPLLVSLMGQAHVRGLRENGIVATPKHFILNFVGDGGRDSGPIHLSERRLRETELIPFRACLKSGALSVMAAYNSIDGIPCSSNEWLLNQLLRREMDFKGFVVSDYFSVFGVYNLHRITYSLEQTAKACLRAGLDVELPYTNVYGEPLEKVVNEGLISSLNEAVRRVLRAKFEVGLFDHPYVDPEEAEAVMNQGSSLSLEVARKSLVLLKNAGLLPLRNVKTVAVLGPFSSIVRLGGYSATPRSTVSPLQGIRMVAEPMGITVLHEEGCPPDLDLDLAISNKYLTTAQGGTGLLAEYFSNDQLSGAPVGSKVEAPWEGYMRFDWGYSPPYQNLPKDSYSVRLSGKISPPERGKYRFKLVTSGGGGRLLVDGKVLVDLWKGEGNSEGTIELEQRQYDFVMEYRKTGFGYAYLKAGWDLEDSESLKRAVEMASKADAAVIFVGMVEGEQKDRASLRLPPLQERLIREVLKANGRTVVVLQTGGAVVGDWIYEVPALVQAWYPGQEGGRAIGELLFGLVNPSGRLPYTWPRHEGQSPLYYNFKPSGRTNDYVNMPSTPLFPFGHGLSYTEFKYGELRVAHKEDRWEVSVEVENVGEMEGEEIVQLYLRKNVNQSAPYIELKGFKRLKLGPKERARVDFVLTYDDLAVLDSQMRYVVEPGTYQVFIGRSAGDLRLSGELYMKKEVRSEVSARVEWRKSEIKVNLRNRGPLTDLVPLIVNMDGEIEEMRIFLDAGEEREVDLRVKGVKEVSIGTPDPIITMSIS